MKPENETYWKILRGELSLIDTMLFFNPSCDTKSLIADMGHDSDLFQSICIGLRMSAYTHLITEGEINSNDVFNIGYGKDNPVHGDYGFRGKEILTYCNDKWI